MKNCAAILFLLLGTFLFSEKATEKEPLDFSIPYKKLPKIASTLVSLNEEKDTITILLSDGSSWLTSLDSSETLEEWQEGDDIRWSEEGVLHNSDLSGLFDASSLLRCSIPHAIFL